MNGIIEAELEADIYALLSSSMKHKLDLDS